MGLSCLDRRGGSNRLGKARKAAWKRCPGVCLQRGLGFLGGAVEDAVLTRIIVIAASLKQLECQVKCESG